ncbi:V-type ATPase assembly factor-like protein [Hapsidospora chrysogenum ATCC 11550]|uniref:V-type ATPase assembly factor-like protein n=1 Tax=Hapsidospora chrysogenum (strain ATCC 11550 / CBS 779.69 / DSM 880 / IAM 14645 / JCM 23072 / IMI 49137) TaxID=857340 RepID=A0A086T6M7_HAPC1|nr:V-type ATPase assembly factor-like protein [Hapsidospora chrysogenum ATCC 11550]
MASFMVDLWESIFTPGPTAPLLKAANASFASLQLVLLALLLATYNVHCVVLSVLCAGLWWSVNWFAAELRIAQEEEKRKQQEEEGQSERQDDSSDTEVEGAKIVGGKVGRAKASASAEVEAQGETGELKKRGNRPTPSGAGTQSSPASTEDEWEKVSESEKEKDR